MREWESERMREWENERVREWERERAKERENERAREWENERVREWERREKKVDKVWQIKICSQCWSKSEVHQCNGYNMWLE